MVSFTLQKLLSLIRSHLFFVGLFALVAFAFEDRSKKFLLRILSKSVLPMLSSRSLIVSDLTPQSVAGGPILTQPVASVFTSSSHF